jgi:hypothetical protein
VADKIDIKKYESQVFALVDSNERANVLVNLTAGAYKRVQDIEADIAWLKSREPVAE